MEQLSSIKICNHGSFSGNILSEYSLYLKLQQYLLFCNTPSVEMSVVNSVKWLASITKLAVYTCRIQTAAFEMEVACGAVVEAVEWPGIDGTAHC